MADSGVGPDDWAQIEADVRASGTSFYWAMRLLPAEKRRAMFAVYAFCRAVDDIADEPGAWNDKKRLLEQWRAAIAALYAGRAGEPTQPLARALAGPIRTFALRQADFLAIIDGMEMDAAARVRIVDSNQLVLYCDRVACAVGRLSTRIFGTDAETGERLAFSLGQALQLTNILRDLVEDAERDRLYLPADLLATVGVTDTEAATDALHHPRLPEVCEVLAATARARFAEAREIIAGCDRRQIRPALVMMEVYERLFRRLTARGWRRWAEPVSVPASEKLWIALRYGLL
ncbi:MAG: presqualene diphosphate synthase HpnD [Rhodospirillales bacterium]|nr:presqualene diphosphate synthase HpnD [Rhodospirillales bacterium]